MRGARASSIDDLVTWVKLEQFTGPQGDLHVSEFQALPFMPVRMFTVSNVPTGTTRGGHAHRDGYQLLICAGGRVDITFRRGDQHKTTICTPDSGGVLIPPGLWAQQHFIAPNSLLLVLCSHPYNEDSYIYQVSE
ncbi:MAG: FdtA/QdtA family cupin domain-containing protein [Lysobacterales bacterium]